MLSVLYIYLYYYFNIIYKKSTNFLYYGWKQLKRPHSAADEARWLAF